MFLNNLTDITATRIKGAIRQFPPLYYPLSQMKYPILRDLSVKKDTQIVIEGFPRSANTFAVIAFEQAQPSPVKIAHHLHSPAQIIRGVKWGIPTLVLLRDPKEAVLSLLAAFPTTTVYKALYYYISFYAPILDYQDNYVIGEFEEVTTNFFQTIQRLNAKLQCNFALWPNTEQHFQQVVKTMGGQINSSFPSKHLKTKKWEEEKKQLQIYRSLHSKQYSSLLEDAKAVYEVFKQAARQP